MMPGNRGSARWRSGRYPVTVTGSDPSDLEIQAAMAGQPAGLWQELFAAVDLLDAGASQVQWTGTARPADGMMFLPHPVYSPAVQSIEGLLYELQVIVPFDWMAWDQVRYADGDGPVGAPVADAARLATAVVRGERFCDGTIAQALSDGTLSAALARRRQWFDEEHPGSAGA
jgi:hypothetical protein